MRMHNLFFCGLLITVTAAVKPSDPQGISRCDHYPESPYVCSQCIDDLNKEPSRNQRSNPLSEPLKCTCKYGYVLKNTLNTTCPYHNEKYLKWLQEEDREAYYKLVLPKEKNQQRAYNLPSSTSSSSTTTSTSTTYQPASQSLSSSTPAAKKGSSEIVAHKKYIKQKKEKIKREKAEREKAEKKEKRSSQEKKSKSTPPFTALFSRKTCTFCAGTGTGRDRRIHPCDAPWRKTDRRKRVRKTA